eukprot:GFUD01021323.1.p1 GENE.GFUD01021323.1~~GFUD01021323.1.p1  ORF type:complete len:706 (-),score=147.68 GFUD01021323.1:25-2142(-)
MDVPGAWAELVPLNPTPVSGQYYISQIETYPASPLAYNYWRGKLANKGWKGGFLFCYDLILVDDKGWQLRVMLHPGSGSVQQGSIMEGMFITMIKATKVPYGDSFVLVLSDWSPGTSFQLQYRGQVQLVGYPNQDLPLCNPHTDLLCPWTCAHFLWSTPSPLKMKAVVPVTHPHHDPAHHNLTNLDQAWHTLSRMWPLVVRVLAKSKDRLVIQQDNHRKPWLALTNLLVADNTAYCVVTAWDEAVSALFQTVKEGDILVLAGRYRVGRYRPANQKLIYRLAPKVRQQGLSPTEMEIKLNTSDLEHVHLVNCAATCQTVPLPLWNFLSINQLVEHGSVANGRLVDFVGIVVHHGRWEREKCQDQTNKPTGQYWVRVWLLMGDHSSEDVVAVKFYVDRERWEGLERAIPGEAVVVTNLLYIQGEQGTFSHLECSNETQVFSGELAGDSRFGGNKVVVSFKEALHGDVDRWGNMLRKKGGFGGHIHPPSKVQVTLRTVGFVMERRDEVNLYFDSLVYRGCGRVLVRAKIGGISIYKVDSRGGLELESVEGDGRENGVGVEFGLSVPEDASFVRTLDGLRRDSLQTAIKKNCHLNTSLDTDMDQTSIREGYVAIVSLIMEDCQFLVQADVSVLDSVKRVLESLDSDQACFCLDLFRFRSQQFDRPIWDGVEVVLRSVLGPQEQQPDSQEETGSDRSLLVNTLDMANAFL